MSGSVDTHDTPHGADFPRALRGMVGAWLALVALMLASLGSAYLALGDGNVAVGLAIACVKALIVAWSFMQLRRAPGVTRTAAGLGLALVLLLSGLSGLDYATRRTTTAPWQVPHQLAPVFGPAARHPSAQPNAQDRARPSHRETKPHADESPASASSPRH
jgi:cytochrome c oxidase subunit 4